MAKLGDRPRRLCFLALALVILHVAHAQDDSGASTSPVSTSSVTSTPVTGDVQRYGHDSRGPYYRGPDSGDEPPHWHRDDHMPERRDDYGNHGGYGSQGGYGSHGPKEDDCPACTQFSEGRIFGLWCWEDAAGRLQDIAYLNTASPNSTTSYLGCSGAALPDSETRPPTKFLLLSVNESFIRVETCGGKNGHDLESVAFVTNTRRRITCGRRRNHHPNAEAEALSSNNDQSALKEAGLVGRDDTATVSIQSAGHKRRHAKPIHDKHGNGKPGYGKPDNDKHSYDKRDNDKHGYGKPGYGKPGYGKPGYGKPDQSKRDYDKPYYKFDDGTKEPHEDQSSGYRLCDSVDTRQTCREFSKPSPSVVPLAGFSVTCTPDRLVESISDFCYNTDGYAGQPPRPPLPPGSIEVDIDVNLGPSGEVPCPTTPQQIVQLTEELDTVSVQTSQASAEPNANGDLIPVVEGIDFAPVDVSACSGARQQEFGSVLVRALLQSGDNTSVPISGALVAAPGSTPQQVLDFVCAQDDFCDADDNGVDVCSGTQFVELKYERPAECFTRRAAQAMASEIQPAQSAQDPSDAIAQPMGSVIQPAQAPTGTIASALGSIIQPFFGSRAKPAKSA